MDILKEDQEFNLKDFISDAFSFEYQQKRSSGMISSGIYMPSSLVIIFHSNHYVFEVTCQMI
ncbi:hypothetical protein AT251_24935 [Enterovibrio nigricans]|nr:hypothetical protein AT251_24935 [Enterovibrio nigricans]